MKLMQKWYCLSILFLFPEKMINGIDDTNGSRLIFFSIFVVLMILWYQNNIPYCQNRIVTPVNPISCVCDFHVYCRTVNEISDTVHACHSSFELSPSAESPTFLVASILNLFFKYLIFYIICLSISYNFNTIFYMKFNFIM